MYHRFLTSVEQGEEGGAYEDGRGEGCVVGLLGVACFSCASQHANWLGYIQYWAALGARTVGACCRHVCVCVWGGGQCRFSTWCEKAAAHCHGFRLRCVFVLKKGGGQGRTVSDRTT
jgi:hypothetical protein